MEASGLGPLKSLKFGATKVRDSKRDPCASDGLPPKGRGRCGTRLDSKPEAITVIASRLKSRFCSETMGHQQTR
jgi:hypothetical protein